METTTTNRASKPKRFDPAKRHQYRHTVEMKMKRFCRTARELDRIESKMKKLSEELRKTYKVLNSLK